MERRWGGRGESLTLRGRGSEEEKRKRNRRGEERKRGGKREGEGEGRGLHEERISMPPGCASSDLPNRPHLQMSLPPAKSTTLGNHK